MYRVRRPVCFLLSSLSCLVLASCQSPPEPAQAAPEPKAETGSAPVPAIPPDDVWFGYVDQTGSRLLMLRGDEQATVEQARSMRTAVCSEARETPVFYVRFQNAAPGSSGRQSPRNLENDEGHLFALGGAAAPGDTCLLLPSGFLSRYALVRNEYPQSERRQRRDEYRKASATAGFDPAPFNASGGSARATVSRIEKERNRKVRLYWPLHRSGPAQEVAIVEFEPDGNNLLASLVMADGERLSFLDMPADQTKGGSCWRVDDGCRLHPEEMDVPVVLGAPGGALVFFTAGGAEGQSVRLLQVKDGKLAEVKSAYRYQAPL